MKTKTIFLLSSFLVAFCVHTGFSSASHRSIPLEAISSQEGLVVYAVFDGKVEYGYNFVIKGKDDMEHTLTFQNVKQEVLKAFNLNSDDLVGTKFKITFTKAIKVTKDEYGNEDEDEINTITFLEKV
ncbi:hypothetical protein GSB9_02494 [Flavobacteriaceae bacterium GSB9]|nr:hypothetical protein GSB9_02494 [Flavobacteriaceae bacterium GSB9]